MTTPSAMTPEQVADLLTRSGAKEVTAADVNQDVEDGAPTNDDGTINLLYYAAWLCVRR